MRLSTHLAYGYGERKYRCAKCGEEYVVCYPIPPKSSSGFHPNPNPKMLKASFKEGISGYASPVVLTAKGPALETVPQAEAKCETGEGGSS